MSAVAFVESAFKHGFGEGDSYELQESGPLKLRSKRGLPNVYELYGRNFTVQYWHVAYRREARRTVVFHIRAMTLREKRRFRQI